MNKLIPLAQFTNDVQTFSSLGKTSVIVDDDMVPRGFVFGREAFISFLEHIDEQFEKNVGDPKKAFNNPAGKLIDSIEEKLPLNPEFVKDLQTQVKSSEWIPFEEVIKTLHV